MQVVTLMIHANTTGVEADVMLIFVAFILHHTEQHTIFHIQPEFTEFVFHCCHIPLEKKGKISIPLSIKHFI